MLDQDIKLRASRRMTDNDDGGGPLSGTEIVSGDLGNIGVVIADLDRSTGYVFLRKLGAHVDTPDDDIYYKSTLILSRPPADPNIRAVLFPWDDWFGELAAVRPWIEQYLSTSGTWTGGLGGWDLSPAAYDTLSIDATVDVDSFLNRVDDKVGHYHEFTEYRTGDPPQTHRIRIVSVEDLGVLGDLASYRFHLAWPLQNSYAGTVDGDSVRYLSVPAGKRYYGISALTAPVLLGDTALTVDSVYSTLVPPGDSPLLNLDATNLPDDGQVRIFNDWDVVVVHHTDPLALPNPITPGSTHSAGRIRLSRVRVLDANGDLVPAGASTYSADLDAGTITFASPLDLGSAVQPLTLEHRVEDAVVARLADDSGAMTVFPPLSHDFPADATYVSTAVTMGNLQARAVNLFTQETWTGEWSDARIGNEPALQFDGQHYAIEVTNDGAIRERFALILTTTTAYRCLGENLGLIAQNVSINEPFAPINPDTGNPYFTIPAGAFGLGGSVGNVFRFNTLAAGSPFGLVLTVLPGLVGALDEDSIEIYIRGNAA
jgi:hypothetical protein